MGENADDDRMKIFDILNPGPIKKEIDLGVLRNVHYTDRKITFEFECQDQNGKIVLFDAWSIFNKDGKSNKDNLEIGYQYVVKGCVTANKISEKYDRSSSSTSDYNLFLGKIKILTEQKVASSTVKKYSIAALQEKLEAMQYGRTEMNKMIVVCGDIYRYFGCDTCSSAITSSPGENGKYHCEQCNVKTSGRMCILIRNLKVTDETKVQISGLVVYEKEVGKLLGEEVADAIRTEFTDKMAMEEFQKIISSEIYGAIVHQKPLEGSIYPAKRILKDVIRTPKSSVAASKTLEGTEHSGATLDTGDIFGDLGDVNDYFSCQFCENDCKDTEPVEDFCSGDNETSLQSMEDMGDDVDDINEDESGVEDDIDPLEVLNVSPKSNLIKNGENSGLVMIINIDTNRKQKRRNGSQNDVRCLEELFPQLKLDVFRGRTIKNITKKNQDFNNAVEAYKSELKLKEYAFSFFIYMGHGTQNYVLDGDGEKINVFDEIMCQFSEEHFPDFRNKPKIFIFAACQGIVIEKKGFVVSTAAPMINFLWVVPCLPGQPSLRNKTNGAYFIQALVKCLRSFHETLTLVEILNKMEKMLSTEIRLFKDGKRGYCVPTHLSRGFDPFYFPAYKGGQTRPFGMEV